MTMPGPRRVARKSVSMLMELGLSKSDAARLVQLVCDEAAQVIWRREDTLDVTWLADISSEASQLMRQAGAAGSTATTWSQVVARWARDFDRGHSAQRPGDADQQLGRRASSEFWPDEWPARRGGQ